MNFQRRGCTKRCVLVPAKPIYILYVINFRYCPFAIENLAMTGLRFGTFGTIKVGWVTAYKLGMMTHTQNMNRFCRYQETPLSATPPLFDRRAMYFILYVHVRDYNINYM